MNRNGCKLETNSKAIIPSAYYDNLQVDKPLLFSVLPSKMDFLSTFKNNFLKMKFTEEKVDV